MRPADGFREMARQELLRMRQLLGEGLIAVSAASAPAELSFFRACVELRIPVIVIAPPGHPQPEDEGQRSLARALLSVALVRYTPPPAVGRSHSSYLLEWVDALLFAGRADTPVEILEDALAIGIPTRRIGLDAASPAAWELPFSGRETAARHGFSARRDLLEFLDLRLKRGDGG
jgi:hypothetical protein